MTKEIYLRKDENRNYFRTTEQFRKVYSPIVCCLFVFGLDCAPDTTSTTVRRTYAMIVKFVLFHWILLSSCTEAKAILFSDLPLSQAIVSVENLVSMVYVLVTYLFYVVKQDKIRHFLQEASEVFVDTFRCGSVECHKMARNGKFAFVAIFLCVVCFTAGLILLNYGSPNGNILITATFYVSILIFYVLLYFYVMANVLVQKLLEKVDEIQKENQSVPVLRLFTKPHSCWNVELVSTSGMHYLRCHQKVCDLIGHMEECFAEVVFLWNFIDVANLLFLIRSIRFQESTFQQLVLLLPVVVTCVIFTLKIQISGTINDKVSDSITQMAKPIKKYSKEFSNSGNLYYIYYTIAEIKYRLYMYYVNLDPPHLTGWGLYNLRKGMTLMVAGEVLTYVLVLYNTS